MVKWYFVVVVVEALVVFPPDDAVDFDVVSNDLESAVVMEQVVIVALVADASVTKPCCMMDGVLVVPMMTRKRPIR